MGSTLTRKDGRSATGPRLCAPFAAMVALAAAPLCTASAQPASTAAAERPNIIFIVTDDQRFDTLGIINPALRTPNLDRLAREGAVFRQTFVTTALCSPSRASIITGRFMHNHGVVDNNAPMAPGTPLVSEALASLGYDTAFIGKWHMGGDSDDPQPGFRHWVSFAGQGDYWPDQALGESLNAAQPNTFNVNGRRVRQTGYITDELTQYALDWLRGGRDPSRPFFLYLSHKALHATFEPAARHRGQYARTQFPDPPTIAGAPANNAGQPMWVINQRNSWHGVDFPYHSELSLESYRRAYAETLSAVDDSVGAILSYLDEAGVSDDTVVIFTSDNGFLFGEHGLIDKRNAYEGSMRVPLLVYAPGRVRAGEAVDRLVANVDFAPTFVELAGGHAAPDAYDGRSWWPLALGREPPDWRTHLLYEYYWEFNYPMTPTTFALRGERYKLIQYHGVWDTEELYDLQNDPHETRNLIDDTDLLDVKIAMRQTLFELLADREGRHFISYTRRFNSGAVFRSRTGSRAAEFPERWLRGPDDPDLDQHFLPDAPDKADRLSGARSR